MEGRSSSQDSRNFLERTVAVVVEDDVFTLQFALRGDDTRGPAGIGLVGTSTLPLGV